MAASIATRLSFGLVVPTEATEALARFDALARRLADDARVELVARPAATYRELVTTVRAGTTDLAWLPPVAYAWLAEAVTPIGSIARDGATTYAAALVAREDGPLQGLANLKGVRAGWVDPWSAAGYVVPRLELARAGIDPAAAFASEAFHGSHREALLALGRGDCDVVGTYARTPKDGGAATDGAWKEIDLGVRVLATFGSIPGDVIAARRNLSPRDYEHAVRALGGAFRDGPARALARSVFGGSELHEGALRGHDALRRAYESGIANGLFD
jgi:phosphate/phosphite/phosphonate ABC transporter binding protein